MIALPFLYKCVLPNYGVYKDYTGIIGYISFFTSILCLLVIPCGKLFTSYKIRLTINEKVIVLLIIILTTVLNTTVTIERSVKKLIPSCQNCQPENTHNACKQIITLRFAVKTHLKINAQKRYLHQNDSFGLFSFIGRNISSFRRFVWPQFDIFYRRISPTK